MALRLDQNSPRFITRYRAIMAELQRVSSTQDVERSAGELSPIAPKVLRC